jgi:glycosyltransferase involved in cell wall biosynthesis
VRRVAILQEYVPAYRVPFFLELQRRCEAVGIEVSIHAGGASAEQAKRADSAHHLLRVHEVPQREFRLMTRRLTWRRTAMTTRGADLVILEQARRNIDAYRLLLPRRLWPAPRVALWGHGRNYVLTRSRAEDRLMATLTRRADHFFAYTDEGARYVESLGMTPTRITSVRNAIDTLEFKSELDSITDQQLDAFRNKHGLTDQTFLYVGGLDGSKRIDFLLDTADQVAARHPDFRLLIAGDGVLRPLVEERAAGSPAIRYSGRLNGINKALAFETSKALLVPGRVGLIAVESIAAGKPILTTEWPHHAPEFGYLTPGDSVLVSPNQLAEYVALVVRVMTEPAMVSDARIHLARLAPHFGTEQMAANFHRGIEAVLERPPEAARR